jgi:ribose transport system substrate-binding protein
MKAKFPDVAIIEKPTYWKADKATAEAQTIVTTTPDLKAIYMQSDSVMLAGVLNVLKSAGKQTKVSEPNHICLATVDGTPFGLDKIREGLRAWRGRARTMLPKSSLGCLSPLRAR